MRRSAWVLLLAAALSPASSYSADFLIGKQLATEIGGKPLIIGGHAASAADYPASYRAGAPGHRCTWFLVGAGALVGAAHCLATDDPQADLPKIKLQIEGVEHVATCEISPAYWKDRSSDWALCTVTPPAPVPALPESVVSGFEVLSIHPEALYVKPLLEISGYGCTAAGGPMEDDYQIGTARVYQLPPATRIYGSLTPTPNAIKIRQAPALLCEGDSGGPAFLYRAQNDAVHRVVVGINTATAVIAGASFLTSTSTPAAVQFIQGWAKRHGEKICGVQIDAEDCRPTK